MKNEEQNLNEAKNSALNIADVSTSTYFTDAEIKEFKEGSLPFPFIVYEGTDPNNVIEVSEIVAISGMADNNGTPTELTIYKHVKGKETERLVYRLAQ
jgi:hypothetical protein